jgi:hypothetical protein
MDKTYDRRKRRRGKRRRWQWVPSLVATMPDDQLGSVYYRNRRQKASM